jgi:acyl-CoA thioesterase II
MTAPAVPTVLDLVTVEPAGGDEFTGLPRPTLRGSMFGGQILGQTFSAAAATVERHRWPVSMHLYFIAAPDPRAPVTYRVTRRRDGGRYAWRTVVGVQGATIVLESMLAFSSRPQPVTPGEVGDLPGPEELEPAEVLVARHPELIGDYFDRLGGAQMDLRFVQGPPPVRLARGDAAPRHDLWLRPHRLEGCTPLEIAAVLAYLSDVNMLATPLLAVGELGDGVRSYAASFDHTLRFYSPAEDLDWLVYRQRSSAVAGSTLEAEGRLATRDGRLLFTASQQGLLFKAS